MRPHGLGTTPICIWCEVLCIIHSEFPSSLTFICQFSQVYVIHVLPASFEKLFKEEFFRVVE